MIIDCQFLHASTEQCPDDDGIDYDLIWVQLLSFRESKYVALQKIYLLSTYHMTLCMNNS